MVVKTMYIIYLCRLIISDPLHLIVGSKLIFTKILFQVPKCYDGNSKFFNLYVR
jgi:hypothetical protein